MLWQLRQAGKLEGVRGIVFGEMLDCVSPGAPPELLEEAILRALEDFDGPIAMGLRSGHVSRQNVTLTFGVRGRAWAGDETQLTLLEAAVERRMNVAERSTSISAAFAARPWRRWPGCCSCRGTALPAPTRRLIRP